MDWMRQAWLGMEERALDGLEAWARRRTPEEQQLPAHLAVGRAGERAALFYLRRKGYVVAARRWSSGEAEGDLDLVAWDGGTLCFVEVKTRTARDMTPAEAAVDRHKQGVLRRLARAYMRHLPGESMPAARFDVLSVYLLAGGRREFQHFENAFGWNARAAED